MADVHDDRGDAERKARAALTELLGYWSERDGDHEGGSAYNCAECRVVMLLDTVAGIWDFEVAR